MRLSLHNGPHLHDWVLLLVSHTWFERLRKTDFSSLASGLGGGWHFEFGTLASYREIRLDNHSIGFQPHTRTHTHTGSVFDKFWHFPPPPPPPPCTFSSPPLPFSWVLVGEPFGLISFSQLGLEMLILGGSLFLAHCAPHAKIEEGRGKIMIWHALRKLINKYNSHEGSTKADKHGRMYAHLNFHGCGLSRREGWEVKRKRWRFLCPAAAGCLFCWSF